MTEKSETNPGKEPPSSHAGRGANLIITFVTGAVIGAMTFWIASDFWQMPDGDGGTKTNMKADMAETETGAHSHEMMAVDGWALIPTITSSIQKDPVGGWNLHLQTSNFTFDAASAGLANVEGHGHAHIYVNGEKLGRIYGDWFHIGKLPTGENVISVSLNANDHSALAYNGKLLEHKQIVTVE